MPHELYQLPNGKILPSVTEVIGILGSPILMRWANGLGFKHINYYEFMDKAATRGTICHEIIGHLIDKDIPLQTYDLSADEFKLIVEYEKRIKEFYSKCTFNPSFLEKPFLSEELGYAGCPDYYGDIKFNESPKGYDGVLKFSNALVDWKTSKKPSPKHFLQLGGYSILLKRNGIIPDYYIIVDFHSDKSPTIEVKNKHEMVRYEEGYLNLLAFWKFYSTVDPSVLKTKR